MKKLLPTSKGFTLIELLVVITIIAVLAVMGFAVFSGLTAKGNDARRSADMKAFADAMEVTRANTSANTYTAPAATDFSGGAFPKEPTSRVEKYCYLDSTTAAVGNMAVTSGSACAIGWANVDGVAPTVTAGATFFRFCTMNDKAPFAVICQGSRQ